MSASTITRLTTQWQDEAVAFNKRSLAETDYVYVWVGGIHLKLRLGQDKFCLLVIIGVRSCKRRGMRAPILAIGDGALGFWVAVRTVFPETRQQHCWFNKIANVLNALPKSAQPGAKAALAEIWNAEDKDHAQAAVKAFATDFATNFATKWPKAVAKISDDLDVLLAFDDYPAEHWNPPAHEDAAAHPLLAPQASRRAAGLHASRARSDIDRARTGLMLAAEVIKVHLSARASGVGDCHLCLVRSPHHHDVSREDSWSRTLHSLRSRGTSTAHTGCSIEGSPMRRSPSIATEGDSTVSRREP